MKALLIDPIARTITEVETSGGWRDIARILGCDTIERAGLTPTEDLWIDEEGRLAYPNKLGYFRIGGELMCGRGLVLGNSGGESRSTRVPAQVIARVIEWTDTPPADECEPMITVMPWPDKE